MVQIAQPTAPGAGAAESHASGGSRTVADLADRHVVDERTVRRYAAHLTELGIPVQTLRGRHGGYRLGPGTGCPLMLTDEGALTVLLGLAVACVNRAGTPFLTGRGRNSQQWRSLASVARRRFDALSFRMSPRP